MIRRHGRVAPLPAPLQDGDHIRVSKIIAECLTLGWRESSAPPLDVDNRRGTGSISARMATSRVSLSRAVALAGAGMIAVTLASCGPPDDLRGNDPDKKVMSGITPGVTDKASVTRLLGSPSTVATFDPNTWYYVSQETQNVAFFKPRLKDERVVSISFDKKGVVTRVAYLDMKDHREVLPNGDKTPAPGREFTLLEQLIGNFGRFSGSAPGASGPSPSSGSGM
jgi:outer membrane protein assembly factor BamE (lipoprotein component of BamABCDE complex)